MASRVKPVPRALKANKGQPVAHQVRRARLARMALPVYAVRRVNPGRLAQQVQRALLGRPADRLVLRGRRDPRVPRGHPVCPVRRDPKGKLARRALLGLPVDHRVLKGRRGP